MRLSALLHPTALCAALCLPLGACGSNGGTATADLAAAGATCSLDTRGMLYEPGMSQTGVNKLYNVKLVQSTPGPPQKGNNDWLVSVTDSQGSPLAGAALKVTPFMPDHGHGTAIVVGIKELGSGQYQLSPLDLFMSGIWRVTIDVTVGAGADGGGITDQAIFYFCIEG